MSSASRAIQSPFGVRDFRLLWVGEAISALGDQLLLVALPWLALVLTGSALALGTVLAVISIPRALLMVVGGASVDRWSPRLVMLASNVVRLGVVTALGLIVLAGRAEVWMLYAFALLFGVADAFFYPAQNSIVPALVAEDQLRQANGIVQGTGQLAFLVGPAIAGLAVAGMGTAANRSSLTGVGVALLIDGLSFGASVATLLAIRGGSARQVRGESLLDSIGVGLRFVRHSPTMRFALLLVMAINLLIVGPFNVGLPMIAYSRLPEGPAAFGILVSAMGGGALIGMVVAGGLPTPRPAVQGPVVLIVLALSGIGLAALALVDGTPAAVVVTAVIGFASGYGNVTLVTWAQRRIPPHLMGRVVSLIGLGSTALIPVSQVVAGFLVQVSLPVMLVVAGLTMSVLTLACAVTPTARGMGFEPVLPAAGLGNA